MKYGLVTLATMPQEKLGAILQVLMEDGHGIMVLTKISITMETLISMEQTKKMRPLTTLFGMSYTLGIQLMEKVIFTVETLLLEALFTMEICLN